MLYQRSGLRVFTDKPWNVIPITPRPGYYHDVQNRQPDRVVSSHWRLCPQYHGRNAITQYIYANNLMPIFRFNAKLPVNETPYSQAKFAVLRCAS